MIQARPLRERVEARIKRGGPDECWPWLGATCTKGYGRVKETRSRLVQVTRVVYEWEHGAIPEGHYICHRCDNPNCCNPAHLFAGTPKDNAGDMVRKGRSIGTSFPGEMHPNSKLTEEQVIGVMSRLLAGAETQAAIARDLGVRPAAISNIWTGKTWAHLRVRQDEALNERIESPVD